MGGSLAREGIVVVTINYPVGLFGFLARPALTTESEHHASGNYGLLDQVAALAWIRDNIEAFGGNPDRTTAMGVPANGASISLLLTSSLGRALFQQSWRVQDLFAHSPASRKPRVWVSCLVTIWAPCARCPPLRSSP